MLQIDAAEGLTGAAVAKRFGISMFTYYLWRKRAGSRGVRGVRGTKLNPVTTADESGLAGRVRAAVESKVREVLPAIVRAEVARALDRLFREG